MSITLSALQKQRRDTAANWTAENPTLLAGEIGLESDTGYWKVGDGATAWTSLAYVSGLGAEIPVDRLADGAARQLLQTDAAGTGVEWTDDIDVPGTLDVTGAATFDDDVTIQGDLTVNGTTTTIDTTTLVVEDKNIEIGKVATPTDVTADGGGITLKGDTDKTINWVDATDAWTLSEHVDIASAKEYRIAGTKVLDATSLGSSVLITSANITDGTIVDGDVNASAAIAGTKISPDFGSQNVTTTGTATAAALIPSGSSVPTNGVYLPSANNVAISTNALERARIDSSGRLLVGTSSARTNFYNTTGVEPLFQVESVAQGRIGIISSSSAAGFGGQVILAHQKSGGIGGNTAVSSGDATGLISFQGSDGTEFVETARISSEVDGTPGADDMPGRLVFSTTADGAGSPTERMRINSNGFTNIYASSTVFAVRSAAAAGTSQSLYGGYHSATSTSGGTVSYAVWTNGNVVNTNNSYGAISDIKLKENIVDANSQWDDLKALRVRKYNFKEGQTHTQIGLIAQEVELVSPGLVTESPDRDEEGNDLGTTTKSVNYSVLYMKAVKALQEAMERIETLEAKVAALEGV